MVPIPSTLIAMLEALYQIRNQRGRWEWGGERVSMVMLSKMLFSAVEGTSRDTGNGHAPGHQEQHGAPVGVPHETLLSGRRHPCYHTACKSLQSPQNHKMHLLWFPYWKNCKKMASAEKKAVSNCGHIRKGSACYHTNGRRQLSQVDTDIAKVISICYSSGITGLSFQK